MDIIQYPDSPFKLHRPFAPAGDQPTAIAELVEALDELLGLEVPVLLSIGTAARSRFTKAERVR